MKSNSRLKAKRLKKATKKLLKLETADKTLPESSILANHEELKHNNTHAFPEYYIDISYKCRDCGSEKIWTARQQKWWYEIAKGNIYSNAIRCRGCRNKIHAAKIQQKQHMQEMAMRKPHLNEAFFKKLPNTAKEQTV
ncbi:MAG: zinc-ribbon domain containing protein [Candidatus Marithrix sp.]